MIFSLPHVLQSLLQENALSMEFLYRASDGHDLTLAANTSLVRDLNGQPISIIITLRDNTPRRKYDQQLLTISRLTGELVQIHDQKSYEKPGLHQKRPKTDPVHPLRNRRAFHAQAGNCLGSESHLETPDPLRSHYGRPFHLFDSDTNHIPLPEHDHDNVNEDHSDNKKQEKVDPILYFKPLKVPPPCVPSPVCLTRQRKKIRASLQA